MKYLKLLLLFICLGASLNSLAQPTLPKPLADSLWSVWNDEGREDILRIEAMSKYIAGGYIFSQPDSAIYFSELLQKFSKTKASKKGIALAIYLKGVVFNIKGEYGLALEYFLPSLEIRQEIGDKKGIAACLLNIGTIYLNRGDYKQALDYFFPSLKIFEEINNKQGVAGSLGRIGNIYDKQGDYGLALNYYQSGLKIYEEIDDVHGIAASIGNIGLIYQNQGDYPKAIDSHHQSLKIAEDMGDKLGVAASKGNIGLIYQNQGDYAQALAYYTQSLKIKEEIGDNQGIAGSLQNIGIIYQYQGDDTQALIFYKQSLSIYEELGDRQGVAISLNNIGTIFFTQGNYAKAISYHEQSLKIANDIGDKKESAISLNYISSNYQVQGDYPESIKYAIDAYRLSKAIGNKYEWVNATRSLYKGYVLSDSLAKAEQFLQELINLRKEDLQVTYPSLSEQEKEKYFATIAEDFALQYDFSIGHPEFKSQTTTALNNALLLKGMSLKSSVALRQNILSSSDSLLIADYESWRELKRKASNAYSDGEDFAEFEQQANELEKELAKSSDAFASMQKAQSITGQDVIQKLNKGEAAVEFVRFNHTPDYKSDSINFQQYLAFVMLPEQEPKMVRLFEEDELTALLETTGDNPAMQIEQVYGSKNKNNAALYQLIWKPLEAHLEGVNRVYYAAGGLLHKVSLAAMRSESGDYLSEQYDLHQLNSTAQLIEFSPLEFSNDDPVLLAGGVNYGDGGSKGKIWKYLPGTLTEAQGIEQTLKKKKVNVQLITENKATEETIKQEANKAGILHIATHGFFYPDPEQVKEEMKSKTIAEGEELAFRGSTDYAYWSFVLNKNPLMRSGLVLADANDVWDREALAEGEDGILTALEISNLDLRKAKLVVLSACETGLGDIKGSEGVYGLQRAFKMAGAKSLIMSLWQVPDKETSEFMSHFYKKLLKEKDTRKAFNQTQKIMRKKYDPYYWAAFVLVE